MVGTKIIQLVYKKDEEGVVEMSGLMEEARNIVKKEVTLRMLKSGRIPIEEIAEYTGLTVDEVKMIEENEKLENLS